MENSRVNIENINDALSDMEAMLAKLRCLVDAGEKMGDALTTNIEALSREERFNMAINLWRQFSKVQTPLGWLELYARKARRNTNSLLDTLPEEAE